MLDNLKKFYYALTYLPKLKQGIIIEMLVKWNYKHILTKIFLYFNYKKKKFFFVFNFYDSNLQIY